ncbi:MAG: lamin tail domain-containing protein, partial [Flavobacteriaceae bacterium]|nr:lamin tail domain-containing protein [Flavobacteriaceae bacterium]
MLKYYIFLVAFILTFSAISQNTLIKIQDFDEPNQEWNFITDIPFFDSNSDGFFGIHDGDNDSDANDTGVALKANLISFGDIKNDFLFINDLSDEGDNGTNNEAIITFSSVDISNYHQVYISFDYDIAEFDSSDYIKYEIIEDDVSTDIITLPKNEKGLISISIKNKTQSVFFKLIIKQNGIEDYAGVDNIKLEGILIDPCSELMISEYIEGTSSTSFRNNFIEIYNPTNTSINLENYDLVKYTGESIEISNTLNLAGTIPAYETFLIEDTTENIGIVSDLSTNSFVMDFTGDDKIALRNSNQIIDIIGEIGSSSNFAKDIVLRRKSNIQNSNNQYNIEEWDVYGLENLGDINVHVSNCSGAIPEIKISGNDKSIVDGSEVTSVLDNTYFEMISVDSGDEIVKDFYIKNVGDSDLNIINIAISDAINFSIITSPSSIIQPSDSSKITISFQPTSLGLKTAIVSIENNDASENPFNFYIQGEGVGKSNSPLMITQYYEGTGNNKWIEITNISESETPENYYLALYWNDDAKNPIGINPSRSKLIPALLPGQTLKYQSALIVSQPEYAIDGNEIKSSICNFTGDDILIISTSNDNTCWENRLDIIGNSSNWGVNKSYVRKYGHEAATTHTGFNFNDWFIYEISEIDNAKVGTNQRIGN